jgi:type IV pilus assembly protein PilW
MMMKTMYTIQKGFSLIEIMVGMTVGLIGMVVIMQVYAVSEANRATTTTGGDAQQSGALGLQTIERDVRMAGYGINVAGFLGCSVRAYSAGPPARDFNFTFVPVLITQGAGNLPDTITVTYSSSSMVSSPASITQNMPSPAATYKVNNRYGFAEGDLVIAAEAGKDCSLAQVTGVPGSPGQSDNVIHNSGTYTNAQGANVPAQYNKPAGLGVSYTTSAKLYNIGPLPINNTYSIQNNVLQLDSSFLGITESIADSVMDLQAEYGIDTNADGVVDTYQVSADANGDGVINDADWSRVLSMRLGLVARSLKREPGCNITTTVPTWLGGTFNNITADANWRCYRYRVYQSNIVIRNMLWKPS